MRDEAELQRVMAGIEIGSQSKPGVFEQWQQWWELCGWVCAGVMVVTGVTMVGVQLAKWWMR